MEIPSYAIVVVIIAIILGLGATIITNMQTSQQDSDNQDYRFTRSIFDSNETFTALNNTATDFSTTLSAAIGDDFIAGSCSGAVIQNGSTADDITVNFTVSGCTATLNDNTGALNNTVVTINFTYNAYAYGVSYNITQDSLDAMDDFGGWQITWVVILAAAVLIGIVVTYLYIRPRG